MAPDPEDFTGADRTEKTGTGEPERTDPEYNPVIEMERKIKDKIYGTLGIKDQETGEIDKKRRNILAAVGTGLGAGVGFTGYSAANGTLDDTVEGVEETGAGLGDKVVGVLNGGCEETGYGIQEDLLRDEEVLNSDILEPNADGYYVVHQSSEDSWIIEGYVVENGEPERGTILVEGEEVEEILENEEYREGEEIIEYCLEPSN